MSRLHKYIELGTIIKKLIIADEPSLSGWGGPRRSTHQNSAAERAARAGG
jgi:hypothetical protein